MKKALRLILMYFILYISCTLLGTLFYSFYLTVLNFVAGQKMDLFVFETLMDSLFIVAIAMCFLILPFLSYYRIRHVGGFLQTVAYILMVVLTFAALLPGVLHFRNVFYDNYPTTNKFSHLSGGYFRESNDKVYYFTKDFSSNPITGDTTTIVIDTSENGTVTVEKVPDTPDFPLYQDAAPFKEILAKQAFGNGMFGTQGLIKGLVDDAIFSFSRGIKYYLGFILVGLALASIYGITQFFNWKLLNAFFVIVNTVLILIANTFYYSSAAEGLKSSLGRNKLIVSLNKILDEPILSCFYLIFTILMVVIGIVAMIVKKHKSKKRA